VKRYIYWFITFLIALYFAIFGVKNDAKVTLDLWPFGWQLETHLAILILITFVIGVIAGGVVVWWTEWVKRLKDKYHYEAEIKEHQKIFHPEKES
jgi:uncharacterized integral membrane protein